MCRLHCPLTSSDHERTLHALIWRIWKVCVSPNFSRDITEWFRTKNSKIVFSSIFFFWILIFSYTKRYQTIHLGGYSHAKYAFERSVCTVSMFSNYLRHILEWFWTKIEKKFFDEKKFFFEISISDFHQNEGILTSNL